MTFDAEARERRRALVAELTLQRLSVDAIAARLGCDPRTVTRDRRVLGLSWMRSEDAQRAREERRAVVAKLTQEGWTLPVIAARLGVSTRTVEHDRQALGLVTPCPRYTPDEHREIESMLDDGCSYYEVGRTIGRSPWWIAHLYPHRGWTGQQVGEYVSALKKARGLG